MTHSGTPVPEDFYDFHFEEEFDCRKHNGTDWDFPLCDGTCGDRIQHGKNHVMNDDGEIYCSWQCAELRWSGKREAQADFLYEQMKEKNHGKEKGTS
jgi:hypothetical protein|tara:strand:- start:419 stop:709 length:291 start_codon:yes stop_codon:yes gene_type:complete